MSCALSGYICMWLQRVMYKTKLLCTLFFMYPKMGIFWNVTFFCCYLFIFFVKKQTSGMYVFLTYMFVKWVSCPSNYGWQEARNCETNFMNRFMSNFCIEWQQLLLVLRKLWAKKFLLSNYIRIECVKQEARSLWLQWKRHIFAFCNW